MSERDIARACLDLMASAPAAHLATIDAGGRPAIRAMLNLRCEARYPNLVEIFAPHDRDFLVYFTTNTSSAKMRQIAADPEAAIYYCDADAFHGVQLQGRIEVVSERAITDRLWQAGWERYYPGGPSDPDYAILRLRPACISGWYRGARFSLAPA